MNLKHTLALLALAIAPVSAHAETYAEKLGWPEGTKALIVHIDDAGMSHDSNVGTIRALEEGMANSFSVMMPCPWVPEITKYIAENPDHDAGLHLTLTSEWHGYRWGPSAGKPTVPGLVDSEGALWPSVAQVVEKATPEEVDTEIRAQLDRARTMGFEPTHLDSHMGTLFADMKFLEKYLTLGIEKQIPVMFPGGHVYFSSQQYPEWPKELIQTFGQRIWDAGLPVLDDLHNTSYGWKREDKVAKFVEAVHDMKPGVTMMIVHCTDPSETFPKFSGSAETRLGDLEGVISPEFKKAIEEEGIVLTTFRELKQRRDALKAPETVEEKK
jgi:chitin disaccharide deacetylase